MAKKQKGSYETPASRAFDSVIDWFKDRPNKLTERQKKGYDMPGGPKPTRPKGQGSSNYPIYDLDPKFSLVNGQIRALASALGVSDRVEGLLAPPDSRGYEGTNPNLHYEALQSLHKALTKAAAEKGVGQAGKAMTPQEVRANTPQEEPSVFGSTNSYVPDPVVRYPKGKPNLPKKEDKNTNRLRPPAKDKITNEKQMMEGFLSSDEREELKKRLREYLLAGRAHNDDQRRWVMMGQGLGKALVGPWAGGSGQLGRTAGMIYNNITNDEAATQAEFDRPEKLRQARMAEALRAIGDDRELAQLFDKTTQRTVGINGTTLDPDVAARTPLLTAEADTQRIEELSPAAASIISRTKALGMGMEEVAAALKNEETASKIAKNIAEAEYLKNKANGMRDDEAQLLADQMAKQAVAELRQKLTRPFWPDRSIEDLSPTDVPQGLNPATGLPDQNVFLAMARQKLKQDQTP